MFFSVFSVTLWLISSFDRRAVVAGGRGPYSGLRQSEALAQLGGKMLASLGVGDDGEQRRSPRALPYAADALAVALCHLQAEQFQRRFAIPVAVARRARRSPRSNRITSLKAAASSASMPLPQ